MRIFRFNEIDSTNKYLKEREDLKDYDCVIAKTQTAGVGRRGNVWVSNEGMAIFSFALQEDKNLSLEEYMITINSWNISIGWIKENRELRL